MRIYVIHYVTGKFITLQVEPSTGISEIKQAIQEREEVLIHDQKLIYKHWQLEDEKTLAQYTIQEDAVIHLFLHLRGMISSFTTREATDRFNGFLLGYNPPPSSEEFQSKWSQEQKTVFKPCEFDTTQRSLLSDTQKRTCIKFLDTIWKMKVIPFQRERNEKLTDLKVKFADPLSAHCLLEDRSLHDPYHNPQAMMQLIGKHVGGEKGAKIALRCTRGPVGAIDWHFDGPYSTQTIQISLNDDSEYEGGRFCYFTIKEGVRVLNRRAGDLSKHDTECLHAVTRLTSGKRYGLFVVDSRNGLGDQLVVQPSLELTKHIVAMIRYEESLTIPSVFRERISDGDMQDKILSEDGSSKKMCCICLENKPTLAFVPCGHLCLCEHCRPVLVSTATICPICRKKANALIPIFEV